MPAKVREAVELGELNALIGQQARFGRWVTQKNEYELSTFFILQSASA